MSRFRVLPGSFYRRDGETVARELLGRYLVRRQDGSRLTLRIVETEAYLGEGDRASHAWRGQRTPRTKTLFRAGGCAYVYFIYGIHHMFNVVAAEEGVAHAVLVRAGEPVEGVERMASNRGLGCKMRPGAVAGGPGRLCQALVIDRGYDGVGLSRGELVITRGEPVDRRGTAVGPRIGVDYAAEAAAWPLRFAERENRHVSRPRL
ncbi:MAG: DNA-3-methyladenine glycosylase [Acidobacteriota bacterium]|nr:DNA-3-methyladenine glycosylase [Acidobacteriota bacterium]